jgi:hypothetical protein
LAHWGIHEENALGLKEAHASLLIDRPVQHWKVGFSPGQPDNLDLVANPQRDSRKRPLGK